MPRNYEVERPVLRDLAYRTGDIVPFDPKNIIPQKEQWDKMTTAERDSILRSYKIAKGNQKFANIMGSAIKGVYGRATPKFIKEGISKEYPLAELAGMVAGTAATWPIAEGAAASMVGRVVPAASRLGRMATIPLAGAAQQAALYPPENAKDYLWNLIAAPLGLIGAKAMGRIGAKEIGFKRLRRAARWLNEDPSRKKEVAELLDKLYPEMPDQIPKILEMPKHLISEEILGYVEPIVRKTKKIIRSIIISPEEAARLKK